MLYYRREKEEYLRDLSPFRSGVGNGNLKREALCLRNEISAVSTPFALRRQEKRGEKGKAARFLRRLQGRKTELRKRQRRNSFEEEGTLMEGNYEPFSVPNTLYRG